MSKIFLEAIIVIFVAGLASFSSFPAKADIDQQCLGLCMSSGKTSTECLTQCTYNLPQTKNLVQPDAALSIVTPSARKNDVFIAPAPANTLVLPSTSPVKKPSPGKDYACVSQCLQTGMQYKMCEQNCTKPDCPSGKILCGNAAGTSAGTAMPGDGSTRQ